jgi:exonuclease V gamma subunit
LAFTDSDDLICRLQAEGSRPLGDAGRAKLTELKSDIEDWIESPCLLPGITIPPIIKLLKIKQSQTATPAAIRFDDNHQTIVSGSYQLLNTLTTEGQSIDIIFEAQPSTLKVKTILNGWLTHVFACATSQANAIRTIMVGIQKKSSPESYGFNPIASRDAKNILKELVGLYQQGLNNIIPFAPETSWAYCEELKAAKTAGSPQAALYKAAKKWGRRSDKNNIFANECRDQALFHAFGEGGPYNTDQEFFVKTSLTVFSPLQSATITEKDGE